MMERLRSLSAQLQSSLAGLTGRERRLLGVAGALGVFFTLFLVLFTFSQQADAVRTRSARKLAKLQDALTYALSYNEAQAAQSAVAARLAASNVRLPSYLEEKGNRAGLDISSVSPRPDVTLEGDKVVESSAEITLSDIKLNRLLDFLKYVEEGPGIVKVKNLRLEPKVASETLTAWVTIATYHGKN